MAKRNSEITDIELPIISEPNTAKKCGDKT